MNLEEKTLSTKTLYSGKVVTLELSEAELPNGNNALREVVRHPGGAAVLLVNDGKILLERQFRFPYNKVIWEIPAGKLNKGENPEHAARRELEEETGYRAEKLERLVEVYPSPGYTDEIIYVFKADAATLEKQHLDDDEFVNAEFVEIPRIEEMIESGEICDAKTIDNCKYKRGCFQPLVFYRPILCPNGIRFYSSRFCFARKRLVAAAGIARAAENVGKRAVFPHRINKSDENRRAAAA